MDKIERLITREFRKFALEWGLFTDRCPVCHSNDVITYHSPHHEYEHKCLECNTTSPKKRVNQLWERSPTYNKMRTVTL